VQSASSIEAARLHWRACGRPAFAVVPMTPGVGTSFAAAIPGSEVELRGIELYFEAVVAGRSVYSPAVSPETGPWRVPVVVTESNGGGDLSTGTATYRMLSLPAICDNATPRAILEDDLGAPDPSVWRFGRWDPAAGRYREHGVDGVEPFAPGRAFWVITDQPRALDFTGRTRLPDEQGGAALALAPGWNQIGSPFAFAVDLETMQVRRQATTYSLAEAVAAGWVESEPLHRYTGSGYTTIPARLVPWTGYFMANLHDQPIELVIPARESAVEPPASGEEDGGPAFAGSGAGRDPTAAGSSAPAGAALDWSARLTASAAGETRVFEIGASAASTSGWDPLDRLAPPAPPGASLTLQGRNEELPAAVAAVARDIRPARDPGESWTLECGAAPNGPINLRWDPAGLPDGYGARLVDLESWQWVDLRAQASIVGPGGLHRYRLLVGRPEWIEEQTGTATPTERPMLALEGRSPFPRTARLRVTLKAPSRVSLRVCDLSGRAVRTLLDNEIPAGIRMVTWDGKSESGFPAAAGVYFFRLTAGEREEVVRGVLLR
jgi:hypothetical protein